MCAPSDSLKNKKYIHIGHKRYIFVAHKIERSTVKNFILLHIFIGSPCKCETEKKYWTKHICIVEIYAIRSTAQLEIDSVFRQMHSSHLYCPVNVSFYPTYLNLSTPSMSFIVFGPLLCKKANSEENMLNTHSTGYYAEHTYMNWINRLEHYFFVKDFKDNP